MEDELGMTPEGMEEFKRCLRDAGYSVSSKLVQEVEVSPEQLRDTELIRGQEILSIAEQAFAYGEAISQLKLDEDGEFWTVFR